jgi:hypothetical protein
MKHIKLFKKIETDIELDLVKFCDENLAYLIDDGFVFLLIIVVVLIATSNIPIKVLILFYENNTEEVFSWKY